MLFAPVEHTQVVSLTRDRTEGCDQRERFMEGEQLALSTGSSIGRVPHGEIGTVAGEIWHLSVSRDEKRTAVHSQTTDTRLADAGLNDPNITDNL